VSGHLRRRCRLGTCVVDAGDAGSTAAWMMGPGDSGFAGYGES
jgi:hypothetical protein